MFTMSVTTLKGIILVVLCLVTVQKPGVAAAEITDRDLSTRLERLEALYERQMQNQQVQLSDLQSQLNQQAQINSQHADIMAEQAKIIAEKCIIIGILQLENQKQGAATAEQAHVIAEQSKRITNIELLNLQQKNSYVSFTASATEERVYNEGDHVLFDSVLRNYGNSYYVENSTFICSHNAYYLFSVTVRTDSDGRMRAQIQLDNTPLVSANGRDWNAGTNLVVTYCGQGQTVWVMCNVGADNVMVGDGGDRFSTFSGTLLRLA